jgi:ubiquinone/menaquinone biosynthesis C-methylase UbiE
LPASEPPDAEPATGFDRHAARYASVWDADPAALAQRVRVHELLETVLPVGATVLDVGCGTGTDARWLERQGHRVVGIDASPGMVREARRSAPRSVFFSLPAEELASSVKRLGGQRFDLALLNFGVANVVALPVVAAGLRRLLRPGGRVVVVFMPRLGH